MVRTQPFGPTAIIAIDDFVFGIARMFSILVERYGVAVEVFRDVESGSAWLDQAPSVLNKNSGRHGQDPRKG
jgi:hypothetical protein